MFILDFGLDFDTFNPILEDNFWKSNLLTCESFHTFFCVLFQNVLRTWYARDPVIVNTEDRLVEMAWESAAAMEKGKALLA